MVKDCPVCKARLAAGDSPWPRSYRHCSGCHIDHLAANCPNNPNKANETKGKTMLGMIQVIPSPSSSENEADTQNDVASLRMVMDTNAKQSMETNKAH